MDREKAAKAAAEAERAKKAKKEKGQAESKKKQAKSNRKESAKEKRLSGSSAAEVKEEWFRGLLLSKALFVAKRIVYCYEKSPFILHKEPCRLNLWT